MTPEIGIVLTGTIIPNSTFVVHADANARKNEYLKAIKYYKDFAPVYFLENSTYEILSDPEFNGIKNVFLRKFSPSEYYSRGKGYQEFEMLKRWLETEDALPERFIKITGRYIIPNFKNIFHECLYSQSNLFLIDQFFRTSKALTRLFYIDTGYYSRKLSDFYLDCNDESGDWAERVLYKKMLFSKVDSAIFRDEPIFIGTDGSTGIKSKYKFIKHFMHSLFRKINRCFNKKYILFR